MVHIVTQENRHLYTKQIDQMFQTRYEVFVQNRKWEIPFQDGKEFDEFDTERSVYMLDIDTDGQVN